MLPLILLLVVAPSPPPHLLANTSKSNTGSSAGLSDVEGSSFTAIHIGLIFLGIVLCIVMCAVPWDSIKCCAGGSSSGGAAGESSQQQQQAGQASGSEASADEEEATRRGLSKQVIRSFKVLRYHAYARQQQQPERQQQIECAICLAEFRNGQKVRLLPQCGHGFHKHCIGKWLLSHTSCPICRNPLLIRSPEKPAPRQQQQQQIQQHQQDVQEQEDH